MFISNRKKPKRSVYCQLSPCPYIKLLIPVEKNYTEIWHKHECSQYFSGLTYSAHQKIHPVKTVTDV